MMESKWFLERSIIDNLGKDKVVRGEVWTIFLAIVFLFCLSVVCLSVYLSVCLSVMVRRGLWTLDNSLLSAGCLFVCLSVCLCACLSACPSVKVRTVDNFFLQSSFSSVRGCLAAGRGINNQAAFALAPVPPCPGGGEEPGQE